MSINNMIYRQLAMEKMYHQEKSNSLHMTNKRNQLFLDTLDVIDKVFDRYIKNLKIEDFCDEEHFNNAKNNLKAWKDKYWLDLRPSLVNTYTIDSFTDDLNTQIEIQKKL